MRTAIFSEWTSSTASQVVEQRGADGSPLAPHWEVKTTRIPCHAVTRRPTERALGRRCGPFVPSVGHDAHVPVGPASDRHAARSRKIGPIGGAEGGGEKQRLNSAPNSAPMRRNIPLPRPRVRREPLASSLSPKCWRRRQAFPRRICRARRRRADELMKSWRVLAWEEFDPISG
jgi:hypothetical protein